MALTSNTADSLFRRLDFRALTYSPPSPIVPPVSRRGFQLPKLCTRQFYFCVSTDTSLRQMPALKPEYEALAKAVTGRLRGDPSLPLDEEPEEEPPADDEEEVHSLYM